MMNAWKGVLDFRVLQKFPCWKLSEGRRRHDRKFVDVLLTDKRPRSGANQLCTPWFFDFPLVRSCVINFFHESDIYRMHWTLQNFALHLQSNSGDICKLFDLQLPSGKVVIYHVGQVVLSAELLHHWHDLEHRVVGGPREETGNERLPCWDCDEASSETGGVQSGNHIVLCYVHYECIRQAFEKERTQDSFQDTTKDQ